MMRIPVPFVEMWNRAYATRNCTNWELLPLCDLRDFVRDSIPAKGNIRSALELGCGRGLRALVAMLDVSALGFDDISYTGIDVSKNAIRMARQILEDITAGRRSSVFLERMDKCFPERPSGLKPAVSFQVADLFSWLESSDDDYDLIIDWMCFHELPPEYRTQYAELVAQRCSTYFILKCFSTEGSTQGELSEAVPGVPKYMLSEAEIVSIFEPSFRVVRIVDYSEDIHPEVIPTDGVVAAKRAYLFERLPTSTH